MLLRWISEGKPSDVDCVRHMLTTFTEQPQTVHERMIVRFRHMVLVMDFRRSAFVMFFAHVQGILSVFWVQKLPVETESL